MTPSRAAAPPESRLLGQKKKPHPSHSATPGRGITQGVITLTRAEGSLAEGQAPLKVAWVKEGRLLSQGEALDARLGGLLRRALEGASLKEGESLLVAALGGPGPPLRPGGGRQE